MCFIRYITFPHKACRGDIFILHIRYHTIVRYCYDRFCLALNVRGPSYLGLTRSISWLLMFWLLPSPGHQQLWYWLCNICRSWSYSRKDLGTCVISMWSNDINYKYMFMSPLQNLARKEIIFVRCYYHSVQRLAANERNNCRYVGWGEVIQQPSSPPNITVSPVQLTSMVISVGGEAGCIVRIKVGGLVENNGGLFPCIWSAFANVYTCTWFETNLGEKRTCV